MLDEHPFPETATTCPYCGVGCGVLARPSADGQRAEVRGDAGHPSNYGRLCSKGSALGETLTHEERLLHPQIDGKRASWDGALDLIADRFRDAIDTHGPDSVAMYVSGQFLTEDYYVANKLMKGFVGTANIDTNSRLCMASTVVGHKRAFGTDTVPGCYDDLEEADLIVLVGSNLAWCHPVLYQRILAAREKRGTRLVVIDPRRTSTAEDADLHLPIRPGFDVRLFNALFHALATSQARDDRFVALHTSGLEAALEAIDTVSPSDLAAMTGISDKDLATFFGWFIAIDRTVTVFSQGVNQSSAGSDKVNAIINCHLVTGRIGKPGMGPFSITGQPNAMGGREVGGLANQLASHMDFEPDNVSRIGRFWNAPNMATRPGLKAVDLFNAVADGKIKALWIMATNPVVSLPNADKVRRALDVCPFVVVSDVVSSADTVAYAHVALPATGWGEKTGTVTNSERRISRQRSFLKPPGECRHDWQAICAVAQRLGYSGFDFASPADIYREYAALSGFENNDQRDFNIGAHGNISDRDYNALSPFQWPLPAATSPAGKLEGRSHRFFADGKFYTPDRKAHFIATPFRPAQSQPSDDLPFILNTGRIRDHWHTMTRTGKSARLSAHIAEPFLEVHPDDAKAIGVEPAGLVEARNAYGIARLRALVTDRVSKGTVFAPMHWTNRFSAKACIDALVAPNTDPASGQPESKHSTVALRPLKIDWQAFAVLTEEPDAETLKPFAYWALARTDKGWRLEVAGIGDMITALRTIVREPDALALSTGAGREAIASFAGKTLTGFVIGTEGAPVEADRSWLAGLIGTDLQSDVRIGLLAGRPPIGASCGRIVCSCMGVGSQTILDAIEDGAASVSAVGAATGAGTNCGSCKSEIASLLKVSLETVNISEHVAAE